MKRFIALLGVLSILLCGCAGQDAPADIAATTLPVYEFTQMLCTGTDLTVTRLVTESVSCLHDYSLNVRQVKAAEAADLIVISGAGLEDFMADILQNKETVDASAGIALLESCHHHDHEHDHDHSHQHDAHIWLSPRNAMDMAVNIFHGLCEKYPQHTPVFQENLQDLIARLDTLLSYGEEKLSDLSQTQLITFHDGFAYLADCYGLEILEAIEEESGAEASAAELQHIINLVQTHNLSAIFVERNGSVSAADIIAAETGAEIFTLDMAMSGESWFDAMYHNIDTLKEALE